MKLRGILDAGFRRLAAKGMSRTALIDIDVNFKEVMNRSH